MHGITRSGVTYVLLMLCVFGVLLSPRGTSTQDVIAPSVYIQALGAAVVFGPINTFGDTNVNIINLSLEPITFGYVDPTTGKVVGGQFILFAALDLGTAPLRILSGTDFDLQGNQIGIFQITPANPQFSATFARPYTLLPNSSVTLFNFRAYPDLQAPIGAEGDLILQFALLQSPNEPLAKAVGATFSIRYLIHAEDSPFVLSQLASPVQGCAHVQSPKCYLSVGSDSP
jgi:hypothetical protein